MVILGVWGNNPVSVGESFLIALVAILIVFLTLGIVIAATHLSQKSIEAVQRHTSIMPRPENKILDSDEDAVVAVLVATIDFHKLTGKEARVVSIKKVEE